MEKISATIKNYINHDKKIKGVAAIILWSVIIINVNTGSSIVSTLLYAVTMIPLAVLMGRSTALISDYVGEKRGGLISATAGNVPELMMSLWSIKYNMVSMAKAGLLGAVITNMLLALGMSVFCGGIRYKEQTFNKNIARTNMNMLLLVMGTIIIISSLNSYSFVENGRFEELSVIVSGVLLVVYILGLVFSLYTHSNLFVMTDKCTRSEAGGRKGACRVFLLLIIITLLLYFISEKLIVNISTMVNDYKISQDFIGIILIPLLGSFGENISSIICALDNKIDASLETAIGSSIQITMFVLPIIVIFSFFIGGSVNLLFSNFQIVIMAIALAMSYFVFQDGKSYWFEGALLVSVYIIVTIAYYYVT